MSSNFEILPILIGLTGVITAFFAYRSDRKKITNTECEVCVSFNEKPLLLSESVSPVELSNGMRELIKYCFHKQPDYIVGLNRGGVMAGAYVALSMGIPSEKFFRCCVTVTENDYEAECEFNELSGVVIVIDSITRSGNTMNSAVDELVKNYPRINKIYSASIVATLDEKKQPKCEALDFYSIGTKNIDINLPWTIPYHKVRGQKRAQHIKKDFELVHEKNVGDIAKELYADFDKVKRTKA